MRAAVLAAVAAVAALAAALTSAAGARADEPRPKLAPPDDRTSALDAPAPPTLPALAHPTLSDTFEITTASIDPGGGKGRATALFLHDEIEYPLVSRQWYVGAAHDVVAAAVPGVGHDFFFGAPELWTRALWSSIVGLSSGGGFGVVIPVPHGLSPSAETIFEKVAVVRPWDAAYFTDRVLTLRPWVDIRHVVWRFTFQLRQGLDVGIAVRALHPYENRAEYVSRTTFYTGFRLAKPIGIGLEVWEVYQISANLCGQAPCFDDDKRAALSLSPSVRLLLGRIEPALSLLFPLSTPLRGAAASYFAARFNVGFDFDAGRPRRGSGS
jgi:hypothetical protein